MFKELEEWNKLHEFYIYSGSYTTKDLAAFLKVSTRTLQRWLKGTAEPDRQQLAQIREYLSRNDGGEKRGDDGL